MRHSTRRRRAKRWSVSEAELQIAKAAGWNTQVDGPQLTLAPTLTLTLTLTPALSLALALSPSLSPSPTP